MTRSHRTTATTRASTRSSLLGADAQSTRPADSQASWFGIEEPVDLMAPPTDMPGIASDPSAYVRLYRAFLAARAAVGLIVVAGIATSTLLERGEFNPQLMAVASVYAVLTVVWWWWPSQHTLKSSSALGLSSRQSLATVGVDLVFFGLLNQLDRSININPAALMALPVLMASVLMPRFMALGTAAAATLILLGTAVIDNLLRHNLSSALPSAGLTGFGLFAVALVVSELSSRLAREQRSARGNMALARQQAQLNRLVIDEMPEGVLVVDRQGQVRTANPSARKLLSAHGHTAPAPFQLRGVPAWAPLVKTIEEAFSGNRRLHDDSREILLTFDDQTRRGLRLRLRFTRSRHQQDHDDVCVVFLEDLRLIHARARQDKLAAMGRMSAGVAHEIRNPLAAIAQANALLAEDATQPTQQRLTTMVSDNVERLKRIVDDILTVAPGLRPPSPAIDLDTVLRALIDEWQGLHPQVRAAQLLKLDLHGLPPRELGAPAMVRFEPDHLRRVMVNLLDNALRHGSGQHESIVVSAQWISHPESPPQIMVSVFSDGPPMAADVERSLFEPFFSTRSRGTGLGLYICRELCEQHGATIDYRSHPPTQRHRTEFYILMPVAEPSSSLP